MLVVRVAPCLFQHAVPNCMGQIACGDVTRRDVTGQVNLRLRVSGVQIYMVFLKGKPLPNDINNLYFNITIKLDFQSHLTVKNKHYNIISWQIIYA